MPFTTRDITYLGLLGSEPPSPKNVIPLRPIDSTAPPLQWPVAWCPAVSIRRPGRYHAASGRSAGGGTPRPIPLSEKGMATVESRGKWRGLLFGGMILPLSPAILYNLFSHSRSGSAGFATLTAAPLTSQSLQPQSATSPRSGTLRHKNSRWIDPFKVPQLVQSPKTEDLNCSKIGLGAHLTATASTGLVFGGPAMVKWDHWLCTPVSGQ